MHVKYEYECKLDEWITVNNSYRGMLVLFECICLLKFVKNRIQIMIILLILRNYMGIYFYFYTYIYIYIYIFQYDSIYFLRSGKYK